MVTLSILHWCHKTRQMGWDCSGTLSPSCLQFLPQEQLPRGAAYPSLEIPNNSDPTRSCSHVLLWAHILFRG